MKERLKILPSENYKTYERSAKRMSNYKHGIRTSRQDTSLIIPTKTDGNIQCVIGTAPVNLAADPYDTVNRPFAAHKKEDAIKYVGYNTDFENYTLCQSIYATFDVFGTGPLILINVLDPKKHISAETSKEVGVISGRAVIEDQGILLDQLKVTDEAGTKTYVADTDYIASFDSSGHVVIAIAKDGQAAKAAKIKATFVKLDPSMVTEADIIGAYDVATHKRTGMELIGSVCSKLNLIPGLLLAPGWSHKTAVALALNAKAQLIYSLYGANAVIDLDSSAKGADSYEKVKETKEAAALTESSEWIVWPKIKVGDLAYYYSAQMGARLQSLAAANDGVPSQTPSNKAAMISAIVNEAGEEIEMDMDAANDYCNANGVITAINMNGWKCWGSNTAAYPSTTDPVKRWLNVVNIFTYIENAFKTTFFQKVDDLTNYRLIEDVVATENLSLNGLQGSDDIAGGVIEFNHDENPITEILGGHIKFHERIGGYTPAEDIENVFEFDPTITQAALEGGAE